MASYLRVNNYSHEGNLDISTNVIKDIAFYSLKKMNAVNTSAENHESFNINDAIKCKIVDGKAQISINVDIYKNNNVNDVGLEIQKNIANDLEAMIEQMHFSIKVKVEHII